MGQLEGWFQSWVPESVFSAGAGGSSVEAWYTSALDIEEGLTGASHSHLHLFVADVVKSFDTVDRSILDRVLSSVKTIPPNTAIHEQMATINGYGKVCTTTSTPSTTVRPLWTIT